MILAALGSVPMHASSGLSVSPRLPSQLTPRLPGLPERPGRRSL